MHYNQYQRLINIVGGLYENHPGYFNDLTAEERQVLSRVFFYDYDYDSEDFPESFPDFFRDRIAGNQALQDEALAAVARLYAMSGMGDFTLTRVSDKPL